MAPCHNYFTRNKKMNHIFRKTHFLHIIALMLLVGCNTISTKEFHMANDLKATDERLNGLLVDAIKNGNNSAKKDIALLATYAHDTANNAAAEGKSKFALGYYRIASIAYWRDDDKDNNSKFFTVVNAAENICNKLDSSAPDRDCFVIRFTPYFSSIESIMLDESFKSDNVSASDAHAINARKLLKDLGMVKTMGNTDIENGHLVNFIVQSQKQQKFLSDHKNLNQYICDNLKNVFKAYIQTFVAVEVKSVNSVSAENPLIQEYIAMPGEANDQKIKNFIASKVSSCGS